MKINMDSILKVLMVALVLIIIGIFMNMQRELKEIENKWNEKSQGIHFTTECFNL